MKNFIYTIFYILILPIQFFVMLFIEIKHKIKLKK